MKKVLLLVIIGWMSVMTGTAQMKTTPKICGLGLGYNFGSHGNGFSIDFEFMSKHQLGVEGDFLSKDKFEITLHGGPRFKIMEGMTLSPFLEIGFRTPKSPIFGGSIMWLYNPYGHVCLFAKFQYGTAVQIQENNFPLSPGAFKAVGGVMIIDIF